MNMQSRDSILRKLGLTEEDVKDSEKLFRQIPLPPPPPSSSSSSSYNCSKQERLLGYTMQRLNRAKALKVLGASEEDVDIENSKNLGSLGHSGRKRSFALKNISSNVAIGADGMPCRRLKFVSKRKSKSSRNIRMKQKSFRSQHRLKKSFRRRSTSDIMSIKASTAYDSVRSVMRQESDAKDEIGRLKARLEVLEREIALNQMKNR